MSGTTLNEIGSPLEVRVIDQTEFSFFISFMLRRFWMLIVSTKYSRSEYSSYLLTVWSISCTFFLFQGLQTLKWFFCCNLNTTFHMLAFSSGMGAIAKFTFLNYLFWFFIGGLVTKFTKFINFVGVDGGL